jgi:hypothetical protein
MEHSFVPTVSHHKWLETRHMVHLVRRHARTDEERYASSTARMASPGRTSGELERITPRDAEALRRIAAIERAFAPLLVSRSNPHPRFSMSLLSRFS